MTILRRPLLVRLLCLLALAVNGYYLTWRLLDTFNPHAVWLSALLWAGEAYGLVTLALHVLLTWDTRALERRLGLPTGTPLAEAALPPPGPHSVDVFIPTYDESVGLLRKTVLAARELRLPHRTWVLDDGRRSEVRALCEELGVGYLTRPSNEHAKAGNLNAALARTDGELVVVLDADFIALPHLLERTLGHFERDERLALVQLPQAFYNVDSIQHVDRGSRSSWHEQSLFYDVIQPGKNRWNAAFWCGSPAVLRRAALEAVGGVATATVTEDILTSMRLHAAGWHTLYHDEVLAVGVAPGDLDGFRTQRLRWAQGSMQILRSRENPLLVRRLTLTQRLNYLASMTTYFQALQLVIFVSMPLLILVSGQPPIATLGAGFFARFVPYLALTVAAIKATGGASQRLVWDQYYAILRMFTFLRALPTLLTGGRRLRFHVTPKSPSQRVPRAALYPHLGVAVVNAGVVVALLSLPARQGLDRWTTAIVCVFAGLVASLHAAAVARLWRRLYRRRHYRLPLAVPASVAAPGLGSFATRTEDLSFGGFAVTLPFPLPRGALVDVSLALGERDELPVQGTVASARPLPGGGYRVGIEIERLTADGEKRLLYAFLAAATGAPVAEAAEAEAEAPASRRRREVALGTT
ncbi:MAG TPA: glycosyltransferase [Gaiellaceae bacterium]|nr:glycosyltransferase [Gaiellaceae bacterium]